MKEYFGKYRAIVVDNADPLKQGRVKVQVPFISGDSALGWCLPCVPVNSDLNIPKVNSFVWVEFEHGDTKFPIYTGSLYGDNNLPDNNTENRVIAWKNCKIVMSENSLTLCCGDSKITLTPTSTTLNKNVSVTGNINASGSVHGSNI